MSTLHSQTLRARASLNFYVLGALITSPRSWVFRRTNPLQIWESEPGERETGGGRESTSRRTSDSGRELIKMLQGTPNWSIFFLKRNLARNQSTHMLITYSMTKEKQKPHQFLQPLDSQCLLPLINFLELSLSRYLKAWLICQP